MSNVIYVRKFSQKLESGLLCTDSSFEHQFFSSLAAWKSASTLRLFWPQSQLLNLAGEPDVYSPLAQNLCVVLTPRSICSHDIFEGGEDLEFYKLFGIGQQDYNEDDFKVDNEY